VFEERVGLMEKEILQAIKELQKEMNERFSEVDKRFEQMDKRFEQVDKRFEQMDERFDMLENGQKDLHGSIELLATKQWNTEKELFRVKKTMGME
jgi:archaellum component FlaC